MPVEPGGSCSSHRHWPELGEFAEVLNGCGEVELVFGAVGSSEAEAVEADDAFEMCKQHLDPLPGVARRDIGVGSGDVAGALARRLMPRSCDLSGGLVGRTSGLQGAGSAILLPGKVLLEAVLAELRPACGDVPPVGPQRLTARTTIFVGLTIVGEVGGGVCAVLALGFVEDRDVRFDALVFDCLASAPMGQIGVIEEWRISGSS